MGMGSRGSLVVDLLRQDDALRLAEVHRGGGGHPPGGVVRRMSGNGPRAAVHRPRGHLQVVGSGQQVEVLVALVGDVAVGGGAPAAAEAAVGVGGRGRGQADDGSLVGNGLVVVSLVEGVLDGVLPGDGVVEALDDQAGHARLIAQRDGDEAVGGKGRSGQGEVEARGSGEGRLEEEGAVLGGDATRAVRLDLGDGAQAEAQRAAVLAGRVRGGGGA